MNVGDVPVAVLAGGRATRLGPIAAETPKCLIEVGGRPFLDHQLELLGRKGVRHVVLCLGHLADKVEAHLAASPRSGLETSVSREGPVALGTGGALRHALPLLGALCFVLYGDSYLDIDYAGVLADFERRGRDALGLMTVIRNRGRWDRSNVLFAEGRLIRYDKRTPSADMEHIDYGLGLLRRDALARLPAAVPGDLSSLYADLIGEGRMLGHEVATRFYEIGSPAGLAETRAFLAPGA